MSLLGLRILGGAFLLFFLLAAFTPAVNLWSFWLAPSRVATDSVEAIVVLGGGGVTPGGVLAERSLREAVGAIMLYRKGIAPLVVFSGSPEEGMRDEASTRAQLARECGLPSSAILTSSTARTTREEAVQIQRLLSARGIRKVMLLADGPGMPRAVRTFERQGFVVVPPPGSDALDLGGGPEDRLSLTRQMAIETIARLYYRLAGFL
jgi:uncharacterized SAM-binding protein YcdF (DUF218 family)